MLTMSCETRMRDNKKYVYIIFIVAMSIAQGWFLFTKFNMQLKLNETRYFNRLC